MKKCLVSCAFVLVDIVFGAIAGESLKSSPAKATIYQPAPTCQPSDPVDITGLIPDGRLEGEVRGALSIEVDPTGAVVLEFGNAGVGPGVYSGVIVKDGWAIGTVPVVNPHAGCQTIVTITNGTVKISCVNQACGTNCGLHTIVNGNGSETVECFCNLPSGPNPKP